MSKTINSKDYFCINCFEDKNIKDFIKSNGSLVEDGTFKCDFCQVLDWKHYENTILRNIVESCLNQVKSILFLKKF